VVIKAEKADEQKKQAKINCNGVPLPVEGKHDDGD
jgi:hypothetical protein